ncbi:MAG: VWA domain-containing protein [Alphaproteobacteria bacterium]|nr:VWA domain-containing protein [Alphaproteobacteria bacterium]
MTFTHPFVLLLLVPLALALLLALNHRAVPAGRLPGGWRRLVAPGLHDYLGRGLRDRTPGMVRWCCGLAAILVIALARPVIESTDRPAWANLAGRVVVIDMSAASALPGHRLRAAAIVESSMPVPVALVATAGESYTVVPFTSDPQHLDRYLQVLDTTMMPLGGRSLSSGIAHGEALLRDGRIRAGLIVVLTGGPPPGDPVRLAASGTRRTILLADTDPDRWRETGRRLGAEVLAHADSAKVLADHNDAIRDLVRASDRDSTHDLTPWVLALAAAGWVALFRRRSGE